MSGLRSVRLRPPGLGARVAVIAVGAIGATACAGIGGSTAPLTLLTVPVITTAAPLTQPQLQAIVVQPSDLPADWKPQSVKPSSSLAAERSAFAQCVGSVDTSGDALNRVNSPNFISGTSTIGSTASTFKSSSDVQSDTAALASPQANDCFTSAVKAHFAATLPKGVVITSAIERVTPGTNGGPGAIVATVTGTVVFTGSGRTLTLNNEEIFLATSRSEAQVVFYRDGTALSASFVADIVQKVVARFPKGS